MRRPGWGVIAAAAVVLMLAGLLAWRLLAKPATGEGGATPSALVTVAPAQVGSLARTIEAYGVVAGSAAATRTLSAPRDVIIAENLVGPGQSVRAGQPLVIVGDTPAAAQAWRQAVDAVAFATADLARVQRLYAQHLAANDQLGAAQKNLADARAALAAEQKSGAGRARQVLSAPSAGIVGQVSAVKGAQVANGGALATVIATGGLVAQLGVEPARAPSLSVGQPVRVASALDPARAVESRVALIGAAVDPQTRLISVVAPLGAAGLPLGAAVKGEITVGAQRGFTVPRQSVVYDENGAHVFVVRGGKAHAIPVITGPEAGDQIAVAGALSAGEPVIVAGAYQVDDGTAVRISAR